MGELVVFLVAFGFYLTGVCPSLYGGDTGEFIASAHLLGLPHAPGFPTYNLLAKAAQISIPFGNISYRTNVFSALISAVTLVLALRLFQSVFENRWAAWGGALLMALAPVSLDQARVAEVFGLNLLFVVGISLALWKRQEILAAFLFGLGLGNHQTLVFIAPLILYFALRRENGQRGAALLAGGFFFLLGFSIYFYLPLRARVNPPVNFGDPETWSRFWAVITRKEFGALSLHPAAVPFRDVLLLTREVLRFLGRTWHQAGWIGVGLALVGVTLGWRNLSTRPWAVIGAYGWGVCGLAFELLSNLSPGSSIGQWRLERFFMIPLLAMSFLVALALSLLWAKGPRARSWVAVLLLGLVAEHAAGMECPSYRWDLAFRDFGLSALRSAPTNALLVIDRVLFDEPTSSLLVETQVDGKRPDLRILYRPGTLFGAAYGEDVLGLSWDKRLERQAQVENQILASWTHPVATLAFDKANVPLEYSELCGLLYQNGSNDGANAVMVDRLRQGPTPRDFPTRLIGVHFPYFSGKRAIEVGSPAAARRWFGTAVALGSDMQWLATNIGGVFSRADRWEEARPYFERAVALDPYFFEGHYGRGYVALKDGDFATAIAAYQTAARLAPERTEAVYMLGAAYAKAGRPYDARETWENYLRRAPDGKLASAVRDELRRLTP